MEGRPLVELARRHGSDNPFERAIAHAAANAHWNQPDSPGVPRNGLDLVPEPQMQTVVIGRFPDLADRLPNAKVIERNPGPGDYPESAAPDLLAAAKTVLITASSLGNGSFGNLLDLARHAYVILLGPSTPLCPGLFDQGVDALSGLVLTDPSRAGLVCAQAGGVRDLKQTGRYLSLTAC